MITINGKHFAESKTEATQSFNDGSGVVGFARRYMRQVKLFNLDNDLIGVVNKWGVLCKANFLQDGRYWYNFGTIDEIGEGSHMRQKEDIEALAVKSQWENRELAFYFK